MIVSEETTRIGTYKRKMSTKTVLVFTLCILVVAVTSSTLFSGRGFQSQTTLRSRSFVHEEENARNTEDSSRSIGENNRDVMKFLKWKSKFLDCLEKHT